MALPEPFPEAGDTMLFEMHLTAHPVVLPHLEEFMRLSRLRDFPAAITLFNDQLLEHIDDAFLVVIECADLLFEQGNYGELSRFLETRLSTKTPTEGESAPQRPEAEEELELLLVMKSLAKIFTKGALRPALVQARRCRDYLARVTTGHQEKAGQPPTSTQIYMFEIYLGIVVFAFETSNWVELSHLDPPWIPATSGGRGALHWFKTLQDKGYLWEAWRVLRILLPVLPKLPSHDVAQLIFGEESQQDRSEKGSVAVDEKKEEDRKLGWREGDLEVELEQFNYGLIDEHLHPETRSLRAGPDRRFTRQLEEMGDLRMWAATWIQGLLVQMDELGDQALLPLDQIYDVLDQIDYDVRRQDYHFESGDSIGSLRMWELLATILLTLSAQGNTDKFAQPLLASATEAFETSILVKKLKSDMSRRRLFYIRIGEILSKIRHPVSIYNFARQISYHEDSEEEYPTEFDVPLSLGRIGLLETDIFRNIDVDAVKRCLPAFVKDAQQLGTHSDNTKLERGETTTVTPEGEVVDSIQAKLSIPDRLVISGDLAITGEDSDRSPAGKVSVGPSGQREVSKSGIAAKKQAAKEKAAKEPSSNQR